MPRTNMAKPVHASQLVAEGFKGTLNLYDACVSDLANALLQSSKRHAFIGGKCHGVGPNAKTLAKQAHRKISPTPTASSRVVEEVISGTPMHEEPDYRGDNITMARKRNTN